MLDQKPVENQAEICRGDWSGSISPVSPASPDFQQTSTSDKAALMSIARTYSVRSSLAKKAVSHGQRPVLVLEYADTSHRGDSNRIEKLSEPFVREDRKLPRRSWTATSA